MTKSPFRDGIEVVAIDPSAPFARALRELLPNATMVVDHWHLHRLSNLMLTDVRQRVTREQLDRRVSMARWRSPLVANKSPHLA